MDPKHAGPAIVAACLVALALADGGSEPVAFSIASVVAWAAVLIGIATGWLPRSRPTSIAVAAGACLGAIAVITGLSAIWASDPGSAFDEAVVALAYSGLFTLVLLTGAPGSATAWLAGLAIGLVGVSILALGARLEPSLFGDGEAELIAVLPAAEGRLSDPFPYWNALAGAMAAAIVLLTWFSTSAATRAWRTAAVAAIPPVALTLYLATSRGGVAIAGIGLAVLVLFARERLRLLATLAIGALGAALLIGVAAGRDALVDHPLSPEAREQIGGLELALLGVVALVALLAYLAGPALARVRDPELRRPHWIALASVAALLVAVAVVAADPAERWEEFKSPPEVPAAGEARDLFARGGSSGRYQFWSTAVDAFGSDPLKGVGAAGYEYYWNANGSLPAPGPNGHSLVLDTAGELGALGVIAVLGFGALALYGGTRRVLAQRAAGSETGSATAALALLAAGLAQASVDWTWENPACFAITIAAAALVLGPASAAPEPVPPPGERRRRRRFAGGVLVLGFAWVAICASALLMLTDLSLTSSRNAFGDGELERAADAADDAIDLQPWAAEPRQQHALVLEAQGDLPAARGEIAEAIDRSPEDWRLWLVAARMALTEGDEATAREYATRAQALAPRLTPLDRPVQEILDGLA